MDRAAEERLEAALDEVRAELSALSTRLEESERRLDRLITSVHVAASTLTAASN